MRALRKDALCNHNHEKNRDYGEQEILYPSGDFPPPWAPISRWREDAPSTPARQAKYVIPFSYRPKAARSAAAASANPASALSIRPVIETKPWIMLSWQR